MSVRQPLALTLERAVARCLAKLPDDLRQTRATGANSMDPRELSPNARVRCVARDIAAGFAPRARLLWWRSHASASASRASCLPAGHLSAGGVGPASRRTERQSCTAPRGTGSPSNCSRPGWAAMRHGRWALARGEWPPSRGPAIWRSCSRRIRTGSLAAGCCRACRWPAASHASWLMTLKRPTGTAQAASSPSSSGGERQQVSFRSVIWKSPQRRGFVYRRTTSLAALGRVR